MRRITKRLVRDLATGELIDAESVYQLTPIPDPEQPREAYSCPVAPPPGSAREIRDRQADTLQYAFGVDVPKASTPGLQREDVVACVVAAFRFIIVSIIVGAGVGAALYLLTLEARL